MRHCMKRWRVQTERRNRIDMVSIEYMDGVSSVNSVNSINSVRKYNMKGGIKMEEKRREMVKVVIDMHVLYGETAKLSKVEEYVEKAKSMAGEGNEVVITGQAPIWLYLKIAHGLHGIARRLVYDSPNTGYVLIFDHNAFDEE